MSEEHPEAHLLAKIQAGDPSVLEDVMRRYNQRLYRVARSIVQDDAAAEDVLQLAYIQAFTHLPQFAGRSQLSTWLTRIAIREAIRHRRKAQQLARREDTSQGPIMSDAHARIPDPESQAYTAELKRLMESSIDALPESYRLVFVCREVEGLTTAETAEALQIGEEAVKTRLHRARAMLRRELFARAGASSVEAFSFHLTRCDAVVQRVLAAVLASAKPLGRA
jgi:RNA polymerase sigma-70 factor (ECF subfamily)